MTLLRTLTILLFLVAAVTFLLATEEKKIRELVKIDILRKVIPPSSNVVPPEVLPEIKFPNVVPLSKLGDFNVKKPNRKKTKEKKVIKPREKIVKKVVTKPTPKPKPRRTIQQKPAAPQPPVVSRKAKTENTMPTFVLGYKEIGLERYLRAVERIGKLHLILYNGENQRFGPKISFVSRKINPDGIDSENLAVDRPYLITDIDLPRHLGLFQLPLGTLEGQLVLFLNKSFDELLWDTLTAKLHRKKYRLSDIASVKGEYLSEAQNIHIFLDHAKTKKGTTIEIGSALDIPCENCL